MHQAPPALWLRIALMLSLALALASAIASRSSAAPYEDRLLDVALRQKQGIDWNTVAVQPTAVKALLVDYDHELAFKAQLGLEKYGAEAQEVLLRFGDDATFQQVLRQYGENTLPVIAYFVKNDVASMRLIYLAQQKSDTTLAAAQSFWERFWYSKPAPAPSASDAAVTAYGPDLRGQRAIAMVAHEGHAFLAQFVLNVRGQAVWVQTERALQGLTAFFFSGAVDLEKKYHRGQVLNAADVLSAGMDVFIVVGTFKALKFLRATQQVRSVGVMRRSQLLGAPLLLRSTLGRSAMKYGVIAGTAYLVVQHPSLLSGIFVTLGQWLGVSPLWAKTMGWSLLLAPLLMALLPLLSFLGTLALWAARRMVRRYGTARGAGVR